MKLRTRLLIAFLMISITPFAIIGTISLLTSESALSELAFGHLENMREVKKTQIQMFLAERKVNMDILMKTVANFRQAAFEKLKTVQEIKKAQVEKYFHKCLNDITVLSENANVQELGVFDAVLDGKGGVRKEVYAFHEEQYFGNSLKQFRDTYGHADLLLITKNGDIVYTVARGSDLGQNLLTGPLKNSSLGQCFQEGLKGTTIRDFEPYSPTDNRYMAFVAAPVLKYGVIAGVVALRLDNHGLNTTVQRRKGMGKTGETYVAGRQNDKISYRSDRKVKVGKIGQTISEDYVETALSGQSGTAVRIDNKGEMNFISYDPLEISGLNWAIITTLSLEEVVAPRLEGEQEDYFAMYIKAYGYDDLFLIHPQGYIFYSVGRHPDYGTNILTGAYSDSGLGRLVSEIRETGKFGFADFEPYEPYEGKPAAFVAQPLVSDDNVELVVALQLSLDTINKVMGGRAGMGETGETYLVGPDRLMRSDSYSDPVDHSAYASFANPEKGRVDTRPVQESLAGKTDRDMAANYNDQKVLSAYTPLDIWDKTWSLIAEIPAEEAFASVKALKWVTGVIAIIAIAVIIIVSFVLAGYIAEPVASLTSAVREVSDGNLLVSAPVSTNKELGLLALTFNKMTKRLRETLDSLRAEIVERKKTEEELRKHRNHLEELVVNRTQRLEEQTIQLSKAKEIAEAASRAKSEFLANMSHEIRTPMNAILGFSEIMKDKVKEPQLSHYLESIHSSGKSLLNLINDILDLSKVEAGKLKMEYTAVSPQNLFNEMQTVFGQKIKDKGLELVINIPPELPKTLLLDETRIRQILINLVGNAVKFTETGYIKLSVNYRYLDDINHSTLDLIFSVEDTGKGIPEDQRKSIFEAFSQVKGQRYAQFGGTGLGLTITRRLIEMMDGEISVGSQVSKGSKFNIILKGVEVAAVEALESLTQKQIDFASIEFEKTTILITDDIDFNREIIKGFFNGYDFTLLEAENGLETIEKAKSHHPDLILLDMKMPVMDGYEAADILKNDTNLKEIPIIAVTASAMKKDEKIISKLCDSYLKKPVNKTELVSELMKYLPHTIKEKPFAKIPEPAIISYGLSLEALAKYPELLEIIKNKQLYCIELSKQMAIDKIEEFAMEMKTLGSENEHKDLVTWSENLYSAAMQFNMKKIRQILLGFGI